MISIIIVNYNQTVWLKRCLETIGKSSPEFPLEIIIIDNNSARPPEDLIKEYQKDLNLKLYKNEKNLGYARGVNQGIKLARGEYLLIINPDVFITSDSLTMMVEFWETNKEIGILAPQLLNPDGTIQISCFRFPKWFTPFVRRTFLKFLPFGRKEFDRYTMADYDRQELREVDWVLGAAMLVKKERIEKIGPMDERFFLYFEDVDWCRRFKNAGFKIVYFPLVKFYHQYPRLSAKSGGIIFFNKFFWFHLISAVKYFAKWGPISIPRNTSR